MKKKFLFPLLVAALAITVALSGCGGPNGGGNDSAAPGNAKDEKMTISMFNAGGFNLAAPLPSREEDTLRQRLESAVNADLQITLPPPDQINPKLNTMIASGDVPDLIFIRDRATAVQYFNQGVITDLAPFLDRYPKLKERYPESTWNEMKYKDKTLGIPGYEIVQGIRGYWIRNDWLNKLNLSVPTTPDELLQVMKAFTFDDPDGNGKDDTYGFVAGVGKNGKFDDLGWDAIFLMFGVYQGYYEVIDGKLTANNTDPRMKEALAFIKTMLDAKVVDPDWTTINDIASQDKKMQTGKVGMIYNDWRRMELNSQKSMQETSGETPEWIVVDPPKGPRNDQFADVLGPQSNLWAISAKAAGNPEKVDRILKMLEYWYTDEEAYPYFAYGEKGIFWDLENGKVKRLQDNLADSELLAKYNWFPNYALPRRADDALYFNFTYEKTDEFHKTNMKYLFPKGTNVTPFITQEPDDTVYQDRMKYMDEMLLKFMSGKESLDNNWDGYVQTVDSKFGMASFQEDALRQLREQGVIE